MSGPKLIELRRMRAARERQRDHDRCAGFASEYARLLEEFNQWAGRLAQLCVKENETPRPLAIVRSDIDAWLQQEQHHEAARLFEEEVLRLRGLVQQRQDQFQQLVFNLQNRHQQLLRDIQAIALGRLQLGERLKAAVPSGWPEPEKARIQKLGEEALQKVIAPSEPAIPNDPEAVAIFEKAEQQAAAALGGLAAAQVQLEQELNSTHSKLLSESLAGPVAASSSLAEVLRRFLPTAKATAVEEKSDTEINRLLCQLSVCSPTDEFLSQARQRAADLRLEKDAGRRRMLSEGLLLECGARLGALRDLGRWREQGQQMIDAAAAHLEDPEVKEVIAELRAAMAAERMVSLDPMRLRLQAALQAAEARRERAFKRQALIDSLKSLGYETQQNLETAFVNEGRLVLRRPSEAEYGVEIVADPELNQLQTALVRFAGDKELTEQQRRRDLEQEERWCADHSRLRAEMARRGLETSFKMQLKPGEHPVRVLARAGSDESERRSQRSPAQQHRSPAE